MLKKLKAAGIPTVSIFLTGRPLWINPELNASDAFVVAWLPGSEGQGVADVILADENGQSAYDFTGRLPFSWPNTPTQTPLNFYDEDYQPLFKLAYGLSYASPSDVANDLNEVVLNDTQSVQARALFDRSAIAPWFVAILEDATVTRMNSNTVQTTGLAVRTQDRRVQEDSLQLSWLNDSGAKFALMSSFPDDLRSLIEAKASLQFDIKLLSAGPELLDLSMECGEACIGKVSLTEFIANDSQEWQNISVDLQCFAQQGVDFANVFAPFVLQANKGVIIAISDVSIVPQTAEHALINCN